MFFLICVTKNTFAGYIMVIPSMFSNILYVACSFPCRELEVCQDAFLDSVSAPNWSHCPGSEWHSHHAVQKWASVKNSSEAWRSSEYTLGFVMLITMDRTSRRLFCGIGSTHPTISPAHQTSADPLLVLQLTCRSEGWGSLGGSELGTQGVGTCWKEPWINQEYWVWNPV